MSLILQLNEAHDLPAVIYTSSGAIYEPSPTPTATLIAPDGTRSGLTLVKQGSGTTARYLVQSFSQAAAGEYQIVYATTDAAADCKQFTDFVSVGQTWVQYLNTSLAAILAAVQAISLTGIPAAVWAYLTSAITTPNSIGVFILTKLALITSSNATFTNPVNPLTNELTLYDDTDYNASSGGTLPAWHSGDWSVYGLATATAVLKVIDSGGTETTLGTVVIDSNTDIHLTAQHTAVAALARGKSALGYKIIATLDVAHGGDEVQLVNASLTHYNYRWQDVKLR